MSFKSKLNQFLFVLFALSCFAFSNSDVNSEIDNNDGPAQSSSAQMPTSATAAGDWGAFAAFGEFAPRNLRGSGTYGVYFTPTQRFKISGEYLTQRLNFDFTSGQEKKWVSQMAFGAEYQYLIDNVWFESIELGTAYSHAFQRHLKTDTFHNGFVKRHIAGSNGSLSFLGTTVKLWNCALLSLAADYDWVHFDRKYQNDRLSNGFGGSINFVQRFAKDFSLNLGADFREPFNAFQGLVNWNHRFSKTNLDIGVFGNLTNGHDGVRDIKTVGIQLGLSFGPNPKSCGRSFDLSSSEQDCYAREYCDVSQWVATPAVHVPIVLAVADQVSPCAGKAPTLSGQGIPPLIILHNTAVPIPTAQAFSSTLPLTFSFTNPTLDPGHSLSINPASGVLTATNDNTTIQSVIVTITATNSCGSVSTTVQISFQAS